MENKKRLIDANDAKREIWNTDCNVFEFCEGRVTNMGISRVELDDAIDRVPTVDAVEVVYCKNCEKAYETEYNRVAWCVEHRCRKLYFDFCSKGVYTETPVYLRDCGTKMKGGNEDDFL